MPAAKFSAIKQVGRATDPVASSPSPSRKGRPGRIRTPTAAEVDDEAVSRAVSEARSRSVSMSPSRAKALGAGSQQDSPLQNGQGARGSTSSTQGQRGNGNGAMGRRGSSASRRLRTMMSADLSHQQMYGVKAIQQDLSRARNKSQQIAVLVQYQDALSEISLSAADEIAPKQLEKDLCREPIKVNGALMTKHCQEDGNLGVLTNKIMAELEFKTMLNATARRRALGAILRACCRTNSGGDSYFVLASLFEEAEVLVTPAHGRVARPIDIQIEAACATVRMHNCYQVQSHEYIGVESAQAEREKTIYDTVVIETLQFHLHSIGGDDDNHTNDDPNVGEEHEPTSKRVLCISSNDFYVSPLPSAPKSRKFSFTNDKKLEDVHVPSADEATDDEKHARFQRSSSPGPSSTGSPASQRGRQLLSEVFDADEKEVVGGHETKTRRQDTSVDEGRLPRLFSGLSLDTDRRQARGASNGRAVNNLELGSIGDEEVFDFTDSDESSSPRNGHAPALPHAHGTSQEQHRESPDGRRLKKGTQYSQNTRAFAKSRGNGSAARAMANAAASSPLFRASPSASPSLRRHLEMMASVGSGGVGNQRVASPSPRNRQHPYLIGRSPQRRRQHGAPQRLARSPAVAAMSPASRSMRQMMAYPQMPAGFVPSPTSAAASPMRNSMSLEHAPSTRMSRSNWWQIHSPKRKWEQKVNEYGTNGDKGGVQDTASCDSVTRDAKQVHGQHVDEEALPQDDQIFETAPLVHDEAAVLVCPECQQRCGTLLTFMRHWGRLHVPLGEEDFTTNTTGQHEEAWQGEGQLQEYSHNGHSRYRQPYSETGDGEYTNNDYDSNGELRTGRSPLTARSQQMTARSPLTPVVLGWQAESSGSVRSLHDSSAQSAASLAAWATQPGTHSRTYATSRESAHAVPLLPSPDLGSNDFEDEFNDSDDDIPPPPPTDDDDEGEVAGDGNILFRTNAATPTGSSESLRGNTPRAKSYWDPKQEAFYMVDPTTGESWWV